MSASTAHGMSVSWTPPGRPHSSNTICRYVLPSDGSVGAQLNTSKTVRERKR